MHNFNYLIGQNHARAIFVNMLKKKKMHHSIILQGPEGVGKLTAAFLLAKTFFCRNQKNALACNECSFCRGHNHFAFSNTLFFTSSDRLPVVSFYQKILKSQLSQDPDFILELLLLEISSLLNRHKNKFLPLLMRTKQSYPVGVVLKEKDLLLLFHKIYEKMTQPKEYFDYFISEEFFKDMHLLQNSLDRSFIPQDSFQKILRWSQTKNQLAKIVVIENLEMMSAITMSKFLKILEDPPENVYFILLTENFNRESIVAKPLKSRSLIIDFNFLQGSISKIMEENFKISKNYPFSSLVKSLTEFIEDFLQEKEKGDILTLLLNKKLSVAEKIFYFEKSKKGILQVIVLIELAIKKYLKNPEWYQKKRIKISLAKIAKANSFLNSSAHLAETHQVLEKNILLKIVLYFHRLI